MLNGGGQHYPFRLGTDLQYRLTHATGDPGDCYSCSHVYVPGYRYLLASLAEAETRDKPLMLRGHVFKKFLHTVQPGPCLRAVLFVVMLHRTLKLLQQLLLALVQIDRGLHDRLAD